MTERIGGCNYMKRYGHLYEKIYNMENLKLAHQHAKKGKGWYAEVQMIDSDPDKYLKELQDMLINKTYHTSEYEVFYKNEHGKTRKIYKLPYFPDRVAQWAILQVIEPYLIKHLISDTFSAIPDRGIHKGLSRVRKKVESGNMMNYSEWCSINSYKGWTDYGNCFRLTQKYVEPLIPYATKYYELNVKKGGKVA